MITAGCESSYDISQCEFLLEKLGNMEEYGIHDFSTSNEIPQRIDGLGYHTYEVQEDMIVELLNKWNEFFQENIGVENISKVVDIDPQLITCEQIYDDILTKI